MRAAWDVRSCVSNLHCGRLRSAYMRATEFDGLALSRWWCGEVAHSSAQRWLNSVAPAAGTAALLDGNGDSNAMMRDVRAEEV